MSGQDRQHWNLRYAAATLEARPSAWVVEHENLIRPPQANLRALDLACGTGQNSVYLARLGYRVDAWDISDVALERLRAVLAAAGEALEVTPQWADLDDSSIQPATYDLVLDANFLQRRLFRSMAEALRPGGLLLVHTLMRRPAGDDRTPAYLLEPGELSSAFGQLHKLEYVEDVVEGWAALVARDSS